MLTYYYHDNISDILGGLKRELHPKQDSVYFDRYLKIINTFGGKIDIYLGSKSSEKLKSGITILSGPNSF